MQMIMHYINIITTGFALKPMKHTHRNEITIEDGKNWRIEGSNYELNGRLPKRKVMMAKNIQYNNLRKE